MAFDRSDLKAEILGEMIPLECSKCKNTYERTLAEIDQLQRKLLPLRCPFCDSIQNIEEGDFDEIIEVLIMLRNMNRQAFRGDLDEI